METALKYSMDSKSFLEQIMATYTDAKRAEKLSAAALELEQAAAANDVGKIQARHGDLMAAYQKVCGQITRWLEVS